MPIQELVQIKQSNDLEKNTAVMMAVNCAPVIKGSKASNLITVTMQEFYMIRKLVRGTGISYHLLKIKANKFMLFLYRREALKRYILSEKVQKFLRGYGYPADDFLRCCIDCFRVWNSIAEERLHIHMRWELSWSIRSRTY